MTRVEEVVCRVHTKIMREQGSDMESSPDLAFTRDNGIDSLGIVNMILDIEDELNIELDGCLQEIRECHTIADVIKVIENYCDTI